MSKKSKKDKKDVEAGELSDSNSHEEHTKKAKKSKKDKKDHAPKTSVMIVPADSDESFDEPPRKSKKRAIPLLLIVIAILASFVYALPGYTNNGKDSLFKNDQAKFHLGVCATIVPLVSQILNIFQDSDSGPKHHGHGHHGDGHAKSVMHSPSRQSSRKTTVKAKKHKH